ncbi:MAG: HlyD family efflux transporter periplasmic adaptor subunit, partial [Proteobacteria bacterium]|nr:HlyD family efflux transporter periplasmic adaptor subunit [Pseudomonadota bacterium]
IEASMLEAVDQRETLVFPPAPNSYYYIQEHESFVKQHSGEFICTVPLMVNENVIGAVLYERHGEAGAFDERSKELCEQMSALFAPILYYRRLNDRPITEKLKDSTYSLFSKVFGSEYLGSKLISMMILGTLVFTFFMPWDYKVSASATLEGAVERVVTSPEGGFIKDASARPGDIVEAGATLATLDNRDLLLEKLKWSGKHKQISKEYREALAIHNLSQIGILRAQLSQAEAQLEILALKLNRTVISSPISAVIVSGDYTRALGSPVERGQVLYKVSPLDDYRVVLQVDESDISEITVGMQGELTLSAAAEERFEMEVSKITPVSTADNGINYFRVEAALTASPDFLRPGMQGIGKIEVAERRMLWVWTHKMVDWFRLKLWSWW